MTAVLDAAEKTASAGGRSGEVGGQGEHKTVPDHHDVAAVIDPQQLGIGPTCHRGVDVGAHLVGAIGTDPGEQQVF